MTPALESSRINSRTSAGTPARPAPVGSSTTTRGESRDDARAEPSLAARHGAPRACHRGDSHTYSTRSTVVRRSRAAGMIPYCQLVAKCGDLQVQRPRERTRKPNDWRGTTTDDTTAGYRRRPATSIDASRTVFVAATCQKDPIELSDITPSRAVSEQALEENVDLRVHKARPGFARLQRRPPLHAKRGW